ncbi:MAG: ABC transporter permease [Lachnospiraceae bacterium]|nr:ABC transporter permease [Lachnospiraceae bacterium]
MKNKIKNIFKGGLGQLTIPIIAICLLVIFNLVRDPSFFSIGITHNNDGNIVLAGNLISIINAASELAVLAMGMTLVTAACGGQDISVGAAAAIAGATFVKVLKSGSGITGFSVILAFLIACVVAMIFGAFNGTLVSVFKIQPMIATLILFTCGRSIAYWINGGASVPVDSPIIKGIGSFIPGIPVPTPVLIVIAVAIIFKLVFHFTSLELFTQSVGINGSASRLNGINATFIRLLSFIILGLCVAVAGIIGVSRLGLINHETLLIDVEMDAILAVAIGGNNLGGGKFKLAGSIIGAYVIHMLTVTLYAMKVSSTDVKAYKAIVIIILVVIGSPVIKNLITKLRHKLDSLSVRGKEIVALITGIAALQMGLTSVAFSWLPIVYPSFISTALGIALAVFSLSMCRKIKAELREEKSGKATIGKILAIAGIVTSVAGLVVAIIITSTIRKIAQEQKAGSLNNDSGYTEMIDERSPIDYE